ncbi:MAG: hypothetical protein EBS49_07610, partial [Verrucomicrobia bacterium]|nr:hypothetical protein [Verrucomicrobiota bacterium]
MRDSISTTSQPTDSELPFSSQPTANGAASGEPEVVVIKGPPRPENYSSATSTEHKEQSTMNGTT